jgi:tRNA A64-2'-O-ribosylphosphate transferase
MILVDSTRSGKRMPDALSKTVPTWCAVINRATRPTLSDDQRQHWDTNLYTPPGIVGASEHSQIEALLDGWAESLQRSSYDLPALQLPLRPIWITPSTSVFPEFAIGNGATFHPIICVSASQHVAEGVERRGAGISYVQGSGDDHELWGEGLNPTIFWAYKERLLSTPRTKLRETVRGVVKQSELSRLRDDYSQPPTPIDKIHGLLLLSAISDLPANFAEELPRRSDKLAYVYIASQSDTDDAGRPPASTGKLLRVNARPGKRGQGDFLRSVLPQSTSFIGGWLREGYNVCVCCESGKDFSVGVALAAMQLFFDDGGLLVDSEQLPNREYSKLPKRYPPTLRSGHEERH